MNEMQENNNLWRMYKDLSWTFRIITPPEHYIAESEHFAAIIKKNSKIPVKTLLNLGSGGGHSDYTLKKFFDVTGIDISEEMIALAKDLNPEVEYHLGDFRNLELNKQFDAVTGFDAFSYNLTEQDLQQAFRSAYFHLHKGGVFLTIQENVKEKFKQNNVSHSVNSKNDIEITLIENNYDPEEIDTNFECSFIYLIRRNKKLTVEFDTHLLGIFALGIWEHLLIETGFEVKVEYFENLPLYICIKR